VYLNLVYKNTKFCLITGRKIIDKPYICGLKKSFLFQLKTTKHMEKKQNLEAFFWGFIATILGLGIFKQFDFATFRFKNWGLGIIYFATFMVAVFFFIKNRRKNG
jgi:membrane protein insertase Oxa1/YidC/SpoIIIJ